MNSKLLSLNILIVIFVTLFGNSYEECLCNVRLRGEYCGSELNRRNGNNDCEKSIYFCGRNNRNKTAVLLAKCSEESECDQNQTSLSSRTRRRNSCLRALKCHCRQGMGRGPHCGNQLEGDDCPPNVLFRCRYTNNAVRARDACPDGCNDGKCINAVDINDNTSESGGDGETDTEP